MRRYFCRDADLTDNQEGKVDPAYMDEVERMTARRQKLHERRERAVAALVEAEAQVAQAKQTRNRAEIKRAWALVAAREAELRQIERLMTSAPGAGTGHRGTKSLWPTHAADAVARIPDRDETRVRDGKSHPVRTTRGTENS